MTRQGTIPQEGWSGRVEGVDDQPPQAYPLKKERNQRRGKGGAGVKPEISELFHFSGRHNPVMSRYCSRPTTSVGTAAHVCLPVHAR
jgi:hypothetical protein